jgi:DNA-binding MarR family transcriptional regulator
MLVMGVGMAVLLARNIISSANGIVSMAIEMTSTANDPRLVEVADRLHSAAIHVLRRVRRVDEESGLTAARLSALSVLVFGGPTTLGRLARAEQVSAPTMSRLVSALVREGLAEREPHADDGRAVVVAASTRGQALLQQGRSRRAAELARLLEGLTDAELASLDDAARTIERVSALPPSAPSAYAGATAERRWSGLSDDSTGSGGTSG